MGRVMGRRLGMALLLCAAGCVHVAPRLARRAAAASRGTSLPVAAIGPRRATPDSVPRVRRSVLESGGASVEARVELRVCR